MNVKFGPDLMRSKFENSIPKSLPKRMILRQIATLYDPLCPISPFPAKAKLLLWDVAINDPGIGWDEPDNEYLYARAQLFFRDVFDLEELAFKRSIKPRIAVGDHVLFVFSDITKACAYLRWKLR